jgi:hypothetical protein
MPSCKTQQAGVEQRAVRRVPESATQMDKDNARAVPTPEASRRLALALVQHPEPFLIVRAPNGAISLRARAGRPVSFEIAVPGIESWASAEVARFVARLPGGTQSTVPIDARGPKALISYTFPAPGQAMLMLCVGPRRLAGGRDREPTHCSKAIINVGAERQVVQATDDVTGETGMPLDVEPLVSPATLGVGSILPVRFHYMNEEEGAAEAVALRPDGSIDRQVASRSGVAHFQLTESGRWIIRFGKLESDGERIGELVFEVAEKPR